LITHENPNDYMLNNIKEELHKEYKKKIIKKHSLKEIDFLLGTVELSILVREDELITIERSPFSLKSGDLF